MTATHLADTSALTRLHHDDVLALVGPMFMAGRVATCGLVDLELLLSARSAHDHTVLAEERRFFPRAPCGDDALDRAIEVQGLLLAAAGRPRVPVARLVVAASAELAGLRLLHYDDAFDRIAEVTGQPVEWVVPRGTVP